MVGMTEKELLELCDEKNAFTGKSPWIYWSSELYSFGKYIRKYGYYPQILPLAVYSDHSGPSITEIPYKHELESNAPAFLTHTVLKAKKYRELTGKKSYTMLSPAVFYRQINNINKNINAIGTIAFPVHVLPDWKEEFEVKKYIIQLKNLPAKYQPVSVCLHMHDINKNRHKEFLEHGIPVFTAGNTRDYRFVERLYSIIRNFAYTCSNEVGTITFFSIEMGIPFFIYGERQIKINNVDPNVPLGVQAEMQHPTIKMFNDKLSFNNFGDCISDDIRDVVKLNLGIKDGISRNKMALILWTSFFYWFFSRRSIKWITDPAIIKKIKMKLFAKWIK